MNTLLTLFNKILPNSKKSNHSSSFDYDHLEGIELTSDTLDPMIICLEEAKKNLIEKLTLYFADMGHTLKIVSNPMRYAYVFDKKKNKILIQRNKITFINRTGRERYCVKKIEFYLENNNGSISYFINSKTKDYVVRMPINCFKYRDEKDTDNSKDKFEHFLALQKDKAIIKTTLDEGLDALKIILLDLYRPGRHYTHKVSLFNYINAKFVRTRPKKESNPIRLLWKNSRYV